MKIDKVTMLFNNLTSEEAYELSELANNIIMSGELVTTNPFFKIWCEECDINETQKLFVMTTAFPQRALLSALRFFLPLRFVNSCHLEKFSIINGI